MGGLGLMKWAGPQIINTQFKAQINYATTSKCNKKLSGPSLYVLPYNWAHLGLLYVYNLT